MVEYIQVIWSIDVSENETQKSDPVKIIVTASASHPDVMSVQEAMRQVLDFFDLLTPESDQTLLWNLKLASTNSPLTVVGEPYSFVAPLDAARIAYDQKSVLEESLRALSEGKSPRRRLTPKRRDAIRRIFNRNMNGIGKTEIILTKHDAPVFVTPSIAEISVKTLAMDENSDFQSLLLRDRARSEMGSLEGALVKVGNDYNAPSVLICERNSGQEVWCRVSSDIRDKISSQTTLNDVWARRRVRVKGRLRYNSDGTIARIWANDLVLLKSHDIAVSDIEDKNFTSGRTVRDYLERLREGEIG